MYQLINPDEFIHKVADRMIVILKEHACSEDLEEFVQEYCSHLKREFKPDAEDCILEMVDRFARFCLTNGLPFIKSGIVKGLSAMPKEEKKADPKGHYQALQLIVELDEFCRIRFLDGIEAKLCA